MQNNYNLYQFALLLVKKIQFSFIVFFSLTLSVSAIANELCERVPASNTRPQFEQCAVFPKLGESSNKLSVAVRNAPPFVYEEYDRGLQKHVLKGISIDFWEKVAQRLEVDFQYVCASLSDTLDALEAGSVDIAISPLTITKERERDFDFSHQYFNSGLVIASPPAESQFDFSKALNTLLNAFASKHLLYLFGVFALLFLTLVLLSLKNIRHYEAMPVMRNKSKPKMVMHVALYSLLNISGIRKDVFGFSSLSMQMFSFVILIFGITASTSLFGMVTASLTQSVTAQQDISADNLDKYSVATLKGSTAQSYLCQTGHESTNVELTNTWDESLARLVEGKAQVVVGDWVQLVYLSQNSDLSDQVAVQAQSLQFEPYGWGLAPNHAIRDSLNQELIGILRDSSGAEIVRRYIGGEQLSLQAY